ncbi:MAG: hypothetical protein HQL52_19655 [Magnetococcales bacterium]|nr:hypothetical protein [Magnetococcales bacterium]
MSEPKKKSRFRGVQHHKIQWDGNVPVAVEMTLGDGLVVTLDMVKKELVGEQAEGLSKRKQEWLKHIGDYLARTTLLKQQEKKGSNRKDGAKAIDFEPRPDPKVLWWG